MSEYQFPAAYEKTADVLKERILALIPSNPGILELDSPSQLFDVPGFDCDDLGPSGALVGRALGAAQRQWKARPKPEGSS